MPRPVKFSSDTSPIRRGIMKNLSLLTQLKRSATNAMNTEANYSSSETEKLSFEDAVDIINGAFEKRAGIASTLGNAVNFVKNSNVAGSVKNIGNTIKNTAPVKALSGLKSSVVADAKNTGIGKRIANSTNVQSMAGGVSGIKQGVKNFAGGMMDGDAALRTASRSQVGAGFKNIGSGIAGVAKNHPVGTAAAIAGTVAVPTVAGIAASHKSNRNKQNQTNIQP